MNKIVLGGRLAADPELRMSGDLAIVNFNIAVPRRKREDPADFFRVTVFGKTAENVNKYLSKGSSCVVAGRIQNDKYTKKDGTTGFSVQVICEEIDFTGGKRKDQEEQAQASPVGDGFMQIPDSVDDEDLPFN